MEPKQPGPTVFLIKSPVSVSNMPFNAFLLQEKAGLLMESLPQYVGDLGKGRQTLVDVTQFCT